MSVSVLLRRGWVMILLIGGIGCAVDANGQSNTAVDLRETFQAGIEAMEADDPARAVGFFEEVFEDSTSYADPEYGPVAYWLGRAFEVDGRTDKARTLYRTGVLLMHAENRLHPRLADAFVHRVFRDGDTASYELAGEAYHRLLRRAGTDSLPDGGRERAILAEHLRHLSLILPEDVRQRAGLPEGPVEADQLTAVDPDVLSAWGRKADPLPATAANERLREHLRRVAHAREHYPHPNETAPPFFDIRGDIYVRLGPPDETVEINFDESRLTDLIYSPDGVHVNLSDFPENTFWTYGSLDRRTYYIFTRQKSGEPFTIGTVEDLLPNQLRQGFTQGASANADAIQSSRASRQADRAMKALVTLRTIYRQYAPFHPNMATRHDDVANYIMNLQSEQGELTNSQYDPRSFIQRTMSSTRNRDNIAASRREEHTPTQSASFLDEAVPLDVAVRVARFRNEDGTTRTEVYWAPTAGALLPTDEQEDWLEEIGFSAPTSYFIELTGIQETPDHRARSVSRDRYRFQIEEPESRAIPPQTFTLGESDSTLYHLNLQWDQYPVAESADSLGPKMKVATTRRDSLRPLPKGPAGPRLSDIKPILLTEGRLPKDDNTVPYPFDRINASVPLFLSFEVYNLTYGEGDRTRYTVEYTVQGTADRNAVARFFAGSEERRTVVSTTSEGSRRDTREYVRLDLEDLDLEDGTEVAVLVKVIDEVTGREEQRTITFEWEADE